MSSKSLTRGLVAVSFTALAVGIAALGTASFGSAEVAAPAVGYAAAAPAAPGLAPTTTSRDWQEVAGSVSTPKRGRFTPVNP
jgi:hypothetical protein